MGGHKGRVGKVKLWIAPDDLKAELAAIEAEAIGWQPLGDGAYLHVGDLEALESDAVVIDIVGMPDAGMSALNVLLLT